MSQSVPTPGPAGVDAVVRNSVLPVGSVIITSWCVTKSLLGAFPGVFMINCDKFRTQPAVRTSSPTAHPEPIKMKPTAMKAVDLTPATVLAAEAAAQAAVIAAGIVETATGTAGDEESLNPLAVV